MDYPQQLWLIVAHTWVEGSRRNAITEIKSNSPYHHQANGVAEKNSKYNQGPMEMAHEERNCPYTALEMQ